jgi:predicted nuclease with TOPRIM domain
MTEPDVGRKVRQLGNDVDEIYDLLKDISKTQARHGAALASLNVAVSDIQVRQGSRLDALDSKVGRLETRFDGLETRFDGLETRFDGLETRFDGLETRFDGLETRFDGLETRVGGLDSKFTARFESVDAKLDIILDRIGHGSADGN